MEYYNRKMSQKITYRIKCMIDPVGGVGATSVRTTGERSWLWIILMMFDFQVLLHNHCA